MREIKFRGLFKGHMVHGNLIDGLGLEGKRFFQIERSDASDYAQYDIDGETVGQYTGMKDKNGKEIYEGDIVKTYMGNICSIEWGHVIESEFENEYEYTGFCFHHIQQNRNYHLDVTSSCTIIGNIHQNPELLIP